jgi:hypothetical protein
MHQFDDSVGFQEKLGSCSIVLSEEPFRLRMKILERDVATLRAPQFGDTSMTASRENKPWPRFTTSTAPLQKVKCDV